MELLSLLTDIPMDVLQSKCVSMCDFILVFEM